MGTIYIESGHSLTSGGASSNGLREEILAIEMKGLILKHLKLQRPNLKVWVDDDNDSLSTVISKIKKMATSKDILLSIHFNAGPSKAQGTECFISMNARESSKRIAYRISELTAGMLESSNRGVKLENQSQHPRLGILHTAASSVLWEIEFITNEYSMDIYDEMKERLAIGVANILVQELED